MSDILDSTRLVVEHAESVTINENRLAVFSRVFDHGMVRHWLSVAPFDFSRLNQKQKIHFLIIFNALSFSYWGEPKWTIEHDGQHFDGAWALIVALGRAIQAGFDLLDFAYCANIPREDVQKILRGNTEIPLFEDRLAILREIGTIMEEQFGGSGIELIESAPLNGPGFADFIVHHFPSFRDQAVYRGRPVYFRKRAQLLVVDIFQFFRRTDLANFQAMEGITACADYKLPQILRRFGILVYSNSLADKVDQLIELAAGSTGEVEIRAGTIWAVELIKQ